MKRRLFQWLTLTAALAVLVAGLGSGALASTLVPQIPIPGKSLIKYQNPLPFFGPAGLVPRVNGTSPYTVTYNELQQAGDLSLAPLYTGVFPGTTTAVTGTLVWGYNVGNTVANWPGVTVEANVSAATQVTYKNNLPFNGSLLQRYITVDQTLHWADPLQAGMVMAPYIGPPPVVPHLHGAVTPSAYDGGPDQWFTPISSNVPNGYHGPGYRTITGAAKDEAIYRYPNSDQEPATLWFHEHTLGATRTNVYSGLAAFYFLRGFGDDGAGGLNKLPDASHEIEIAIQDRMFDTQGQLFFPDVGLNPTIHPFWVPEFIGDVITVNGKVWPTLTVDPRRYRLRFLEGSNARFYNLSFQAVGGPQGSKKPKPSFWVIGTDGGFLDNPVNTPTLLYAPGERYDTIVDFTAFAGQTFLIVNDARAPFPGGKPVDPSTVGQIMQIVVNPGAVTDNSYNPASGVPLRGAGATATTLPPIVRLADPATGQLAAGVTPLRVRQLTLNEILGKGGPLEILVNNTKWNGKRADGVTPVVNGQPYTISSDSGPDNIGNDATNYLTELPQVSSTEVWEIINLTADSHPIHFHEFQFQILNRQAITLNGSKGYLAAYNAAFPPATPAVPGGVFIPDFGPPLPYNNVQGTETSIPAGGGTAVPLPIIGGNPNVIPFLRGLPILPRLYEAGWKDTFIMNPGEVTRVVVRWTPQDTSIATGQANLGTSLFSFDPTNFNNPVNGVVTSATNPEGPGYVWHCHIVDHEDNEMMRPYIPVKNANNLKD